MPVELDAPVPLLLLAAQFWLDLIQQQDTFTVGSLISHTEVFPFASTPFAAPDEFSSPPPLLPLLLPAWLEEEEVLVVPVLLPPLLLASFGSVLIVTPLPGVDWLPLLAAPELPFVADEAVVVWEGACMMQSCQTRSGRMTAGDLLISADDILSGLPRSFEGDSGTVSGGVIMDL